MQKQGMKHLKSEIVLKTKTLYGNQYVWKMANNFYLEDDTKLAHEVQNYKCI